MSPEVLPDIPRIFTAIAEWLGSIVFISASGWRLNRPRNVLLVVIALPVFVVFQSLLGYAPISLWMPGMFAALALIILFVYLCSYVDWSGAVYVGLRAFVLAELMASLEWQLEFYFAGSQMEPRGWVSFLWLAGTYALGSSAAYLLVRRSFQRVGRLHVDANVVLGSLAITLATFLASNISFGPFESPFSGSMARDVANVRTLVGLAGFIALVAQEGLRMREREAAELAGAQMLLRSQQAQYILSRANMDEVDRKYHDLKHYIAAIRAESSEGKRSLFLDRLERSASSYGSQVRSGNLALDAVISAKKTASRDRNITMTEVLDGAALDFVDPLDLAVVIGNALDNAVEAVTMVSEEEKRLIKVALFRQGDLAVLRVENYFTQAPKFENGELVTIKEDKRNHGFGLRSIRETVERYGGSVVVAPEANWFTLKILVPIPGSN